MTATVAKLFDQRTAPRHPVDVDGTLRDTENEPHEVVVVDLSLTGFRIPGATDVAVFSRIGLGLTGLGSRSAKVVRRDEQGWYGCTFDVPLTASELRRVVSEKPVSTVVSMPWSPDPILDCPSTGVKLFSSRTKAWIIICISLSLWTGLSAAAWAML